MNKTILLLITLLVAMPFVFADATITPSNPDTDDALTCDVTGSSSTYDYYWFEGNQMRHHQRATSSTLSSSFTAPDEDWKCMAYIPANSQFPETFHSEDEVSIASAAPQNSCPVFSENSVSHSGDEGFFISFNVPEAEDADGDSITYTANNLPSGASFGQTTRFFSWLPGQSDVGNHVFTVTASDGNANCNNFITVNVDIGDVNRAPEIAPLPDRTVQEESFLGFTVVASDSDGDPITLGYSGVLPFGASFNQNTGEFAWTPTDTQAGVYTVEFVAFDTLGAEDRETVQITVFDSNNPPILNAIGNQVVEELQTLSFQISGADPDGDLLSYTAFIPNEALGAGASFDVATRTFTMNPQIGDAGIYFVTFFVQDQAGLQDEELVQIQVTAIPECRDGIDNDGNGDTDFPFDAGCSNPDDTTEIGGTNQLPFATIDVPSTDITVVRGTDVFFAGTGVDPDGFITSHSWDFDGAAPTSNVEDPGQITMTADGVYTIVYTVTDDDGATGSDSVTVTVTSPACDDGIDNDGDGLTDLADPGCANPDDNDEFNNPLPTGPVVTIDSPATDLTITLNDLVDFAGTATDADGFIVSYLWTFYDDNGLVVSTVEDPGFVSFPITGTHVVSFTATDDDGLTGTDTVTITVIPETQCGDGIDNDGDGNTDFPADAGCTDITDDDESDDNPNQAPIVTIDIPPVSLVIDEGDAVDFAGTATDADGIIVSYDWDFDGAAPNAIVEDPGLITFTTVGTYTIVFTATDNDGASGSDSVVVDVQQLGGLPQCSDGVDNDGDGLVDFPADPDCADANDNEELGNPVLACNDGIDNDGDGFTDFPADPGCSSPTDNDETDVVLPACFDGIDNDLDGFIDFPNDPGCADATDNDETDPVVIPACADGIDNDGDGLVDLADPGCVDAQDNDETNPTFPACNDGIDNDGDGFTDFPADQGCSSPNDNNEFNANTLPACSDGLDNDNDGLIDMNDPGCLIPTDDNEFNQPIGPGTDNKRHVQKLNVVQLGLIHGEEYGSANCQAGVNDDLTVSMEYDSFGCVVEENGERFVRVYMVVQNPNKFPLDDLVLTLDLLDIGVRRSIGPMRLGALDAAAQEISVMIPHDTPTGSYAMRISIDNEYTTRTLYRNLEVVRPLDAGIPAISGHVVQADVAQPLDAANVPQTPAQTAQKGLVCSPVNPHDSILDTVAKWIACWLSKLML